MLRAIWRLGYRGFWRSIYAVLILELILVIVIIRKDNQCEFEHYFLRQLNRLSVDIDGMSRDVEIAGRVVPRFLEYSETEMNQAIADSLDRTTGIRFVHEEGRFVPASVSSAAKLLTLLGNSLFLNEAELFDNLLAEDSRHRVIRPEGLLFSQRPVQAVIGDLLLLRRYARYRLQPLLLEDPERIARVWQRPFDPFSADIPPKHWQLLPRAPLISGLVWLILSFGLVQGYTVAQERREARPLTRYQLRHWNTWLTALLLLPGALLTVMVYPLTRRRVRRQRPRPQVPVVAQPAPVNQTANTVTGPTDQNPDSQERGEPVQKRVASYFIRASRIQLETLQAAGIEAAGRTIADGRWGIVFPQDQVRLVSVILDLPFRTEGARSRVAGNTWFLPINRLELKRRRAVERTHGDRWNIRAAYVALCHSRLEIEEKDAAQQLPALEQQQDDVLRQVMVTSRQIDLVRARLAAIAEAKTTRGTPEWIAEEFDRLCAMPEIEGLSVDVKQRKLIVWTSMLYGEESSETGTKYYELGQFEIHIPANLGPGGIRLYNRTHRQEKEHDAPYVHNGYPDSGCYGNAATSLYVHLGRLEFSVVVPLLIQFLTRDLRGMFKSNGWDKEVSIEIARPHLVRTRDETDSTTKGGS